MHYCPDCGQACYCSGDIDDTPVYQGYEGPEWCRCDCDEVEDEYYCLDEDLEAGWAP